MITIHLNGEPQTFDPQSPLTVTELLTQFRYPSQGLAVAIDGRVIPKSQWATTPISTGQAIEIVAPMQGG